MKMLFYVRRHTCADGAFEWYVLNGHARRRASISFPTRGRPPPRQRRSQASVPDWVWSNKTPLGPGGPAGFFCARRFWMVPSCLVNSKHAYSFRKIATLLIENAARLACIISSVAEKLSASFLTLRVAELLRVDDPRDDTDVPGLELIAREPLPQSLLRRTIPPLG